jgi:DNA-binding response OmpR family regulator
MDNDRVKLLIVGEGTRLRLLAEQLNLDGYDVRRASDSRELRARCTPGNIDLVILAAGADPASLLAGLRAIRAGDLEPEIPVSIRVLWSASAETLADVIRAFDAGADDVIRTPFEYAELLARVRALLRRAPAPTPVVFRYDALQIDTGAHRASFRSRVLDLSPQEYTLLAHLARDPARVHTKAELLQNVWGYRSPASTRTVDSHASRVRRTLARAGAEGWLQAVWGVGYRLAPEAPVPLRVIAGGLSA